MRRRRKAHRPSHRGPSLDADGEDVAARRRRRDPLGARRQADPRQLLLDARVRLSNRPRRPTLASLGSPVRCARAPPARRLVGSAAVTTGPACEGGERPHAPRLLAQTCGSRVGDGCRTDRHQPERDDPVRSEDAEHKPAGEHDHAETTFDDAGAARHLRALTGGCRRLRSWSPFGGGQWRRMHRAG